MTGASNLLGTIPDLPPIVAGAHAAGARVFVDAVHLAPHRRIDVMAIGCDVLVTSPYKWYGPHAGVLCADPARARRAAGGQGPAGARPRTAALGDGHTELRGHRRRRCGRPIPARRGPRPAGRRRGGWSSPRCSRASWRIAGVHGLGPADAGRSHADDRLHGRRADAPARSPQRWPCERIATWAGHSYAVEVVDQLGLADRGGVVRAGVVAYIEPDDVTRLLTVVERLSPGSALIWAVCASGRSAPRSRETIRAQMTGATLTRRRRRCGRGLGVEEGDDLDGGEVLGHLARAAGAGQDGRHVRVLRAPREGQLGQRAAQLVGDRPQRLDPAGAPARRTAPWPASRNRAGRRGNPRGCRRGTCPSAGRTPAGSRSWRRSRVSSNSRAYSRSTRSRDSRLYCGCSVTGLWRWCRSAISMAPRISSASHSLVPQYSALPATTMSRHRPHRLLQRRVRVGAVAVEDVDEVLPNRSSDPSMAVNQVLAVQRVAHVRRRRGCPRTTSW